MGTTTAMSEIIVETWPGLGLPEREIRAALTYLAYKTGKPVQFRPWQRQPCYSDRAVVVYACTRCTEPHRSGINEVLLGGDRYALEPGQAVFEPTGIDGATIVDEQGVVIAKVSHNCIVILVEIAAADTDLSRAVLAHVVEASLPLLDFEVGALRGARVQRFETAFAAAFRSRLGARLKERREELEGIERSVERACRSIIDAEYQRPYVQKELEALQRLATIPNPFAVHRQAEALLGLQETGGYESVECQDEGSIVARTSPIVIEHDGWRFPVGRFEVSIATDGEVLTRNLESHENADHPHPHVGTDYRPCLGNVAGDVAKLVGRMRFAETLQILHRFLCSYNRDGAYERIDRFDPTGQYVDGDDDPCEDCDEKCSPWCIHGCEHNDWYACRDCYEYRTAWCFQECEYNRDWSLQDPCDPCEHEACLEHECPYFKKKCEVNSG